MEEIMILRSFLHACDRSSLTIPADSAAFRFKHFSQNGIDIYTNNPHLWPDPELFDLLALAQHYRLPTRLLDWSRNPYIAAFFAAYSAIENRVDSEHIAVWVLPVNSCGHTSGIQIVNTPSGINKNIAAQDGTFTLLRGIITDKENRKIECIAKHLASADNCQLHRICLPNELSSKLIEHCELFGISIATVQPDLYGAAEYAKMIYQKKEFDNELHPIEETPDDFFDR
jgi:hypothetical protein